jgi:hypothetical protein
MPKNVGFYNPNQKDRILTGGGAWCILSLDHPIFLPPSSSTRTLLITSYYLLQLRYFRISPLPGTLLYRNHERANNSEEQVGRTQTPNFCVGRQISTLKFWRNSYTGTWHVQKLQAGENLVHRSIRTTEQMEVGVLIYPTSHLRRITS